MKNKLILLLALMTVTLLPAATLSGVIKDNKSKKALAFANVAVYERETEIIKTGTMSGVDGTFRIFNIPAGDYYLVITYMGYEKKQFNDINLKNGNVEVGTILLEPTTIQMNNVTVEADKPAITYKLDKQVIDAKQFTFAAGGTAVEILENVPSVQVDIDGNVSLQGSRNITVMIDGRTSIMDPQDALKTIPAETIDNIEIMTNASAKYEAEGGAGIINVVTKRNKLVGLSGLATLRAGSNTVTGSALLSYRNKKIASYISFNSRLGNYNTGSYLDRYLYYPDTTANYKFQGDRENNSKGLVIMGGLDWYISKNDILGLSANYMPNTSESSYIKDYSIIYSDPFWGTIFNTQDYVSYENSNYISKRFKIVADYKHTFPEISSDSTKSKEGGKTNSSTKHQIVFAASCSNLETDRESSTFLVDEYTDTTEGQWTTKSNPTYSIQGKFEYKRPLSENSHFESGANATFNLKGGNNNVYEYDPLTRDFHFLEQFSNLTAYKQNTFAAFAVYSAEFGKFGFQPGVRAEYTYREINSDAVDSVYVIDSLHIFPTIHLSYQFPSNIQCMASYSRRINRPSGFMLEPFYTWQDAYNISIGNPALKPEMIDSYNLSLMKSFGRNSLSFNASYRYINDNFQGIQTIYEEGEDVILTTFENVGNTQSMGFGLSANLSPFNWWMLSISGNLHFRKIEGELYGEDIEKEYLSYMVFYSTSLTLPTKSRIYLSGHYMSKSTTVQGTNYGRFTSSMGINHNFFKNKLTVSLSITDIFGEDTYTFETYTPTTYSYSENYHVTPTFSLSLSLKINNYKKYRNNDSFEADNFNSEGSSQY